MKICPRCGTEQEDSALFCSNCGTTFATAPAVSRVEPVAEQLDTAQPVQVPVSAAAPVQNPAPQPVQPPVAPQIPVQPPVAPQFPVQPPVAPQPQYIQPNYQQPVYTKAPPARIMDYDHTADFDAKDISDNKPYAMLIYLMSTVGIIIALLASQDSPYLKFHIRQAIKLMVTEALVGVITALLVWTVIVPIAGGIAMIALLVIKVISFINVLKNKSIEPAIVRDLKFLK